MPAPSPDHRTAQPVPHRAEPTRMAEPVASAESPASRRFGRIWYVPTAAIRPTALQLRKNLSRDELQGLAESIREKGMAQPVLLRCRPGMTDAFELIAGYRRWRAAMLANLGEVPAIVVDRIGDREAFELAVVENLQRRDLTVLEEAEAFRILVEEHGQTHEQVAALTGRSRSHVSNILRLLSLPQPVKEMIEAGRISFGHARALLAAEAPAQLAARVAAERLTVRETEQIISTAPRAGDAGSVAPTRPVAARPGPPEARQPARREDASRPPATDELAVLQAEIAQELGSTVEIKADGREPTICIRAGSSQEAAAAARMIRDALQLLNMSRAMRRLAGSA